MAERVDDLAATIRKKSATLTSYADTLVRNPRSTIEPAKVDSQEQRRAIAAWRALAAPPESGARSLTFEKTIGEGGMGVVHLAEQMTLGRKVAVKTLRDSADPDAVLKLLREAWITGALEHPNVVPVYDVSVDDKGGPLIVLKRIEGLAWADLMHDYAAIEERFGATDPLEWNLRTLGQVCNAIHFAHARGVLHRDLKPGNVMIGGFGEVYVLDWGIAVALHDDGTGRFPLARDANDTAGTPVYMAPEMLGGEGARLSERTDVYLIGAILHEIVSGKPPHDGAEMENIVASIVVSEPKLPPDTDEDLARIVTRAMSREPEDRYQSAEDVRLAIEAYLRHRGSMRLARGATDSLEKLRDAIRLQEVQRRVLYNLLGECRFGYRAALVESQGNVLAKQGLRDALLAVAEWELGQGEPEGAAVLVDELDDVPSSLLERIEIVRKEKEAERARIAKLERLGQELDKGPGALTRSFIMGIFGIFWVGLPLLQYHTSDRHLTSHAFSIAVDVGLALLAIGLGYWARESMLKTAVNRRLSASLLLAFVAQIIVEVGFWAAGQSATTAHWVHIAIWFAILGSVVINLERGLWPSLVAIAIVFVAAGFFPAAIYLGMSVANAVLVINAVAVWLPRDRIRQGIRDRHL
ncbi:MAG: serine/threonine-protein kinase [Polyangiales bacterium]